MLLRSLLILKQLQGAFKCLIRHFTPLKRLHVLKALRSKAFAAAWWMVMGCQVNADGRRGVWIWESRCTSMGGNVC